MTKNEPQTNKPKETDDKKPAVVPFTVKGQIVAVDAGIVLEGVPVVLNDKVGISKFTKTDSRGEYSFDFDGMKDPKLFFPKDHFQPNQSGKPSTFTLMTPSSIEVNPKTGSVVSYYSVSPVGAFLGVAANLLTDVASINSQLRENLGSIAAGIAASTKSVTKVETIVSDPITIVEKRPDVVVFNDEKVKAIIARAADAWEAAKERMSVSVKFLTRDRRRVLKTDSKLEKFQDEIAALPREAHLEATWLHNRVGRVTPSNARQIKVEAVDRYTRRRAEVIGRVLGLARAANAQANSETATQATVILYRSIGEVLTDLAERLGPILRDLEGAEPEQPIAFEPVVIPDLI